MVEMREMRTNCTLKILAAFTGINEMTAEEISFKAKVGSSNVYILLNKLEAQGRITYTYRESTHGRTIRYYRLTKIHFEKKE